MSLRASTVDAGYLRTPVLRDVSCTIESGCVTAILGPNGAGKTTLLRVLLGAMSPGRGSVTIDGAALRSLPSSERAGRVGFIPQATVADLPYSVLEVVRLGRVSRGEPTGRSTLIARAALGAVGLLARADEALGTLSAGQQQRVLLARALAQIGACEERDAGERAARQAAPGAGSTGALAGRYLLADEPVASMDPRHALASLDLLRGAARAGVGVGVVLHDFALAAKFADRAILLGQDGRVKAEGSAGEVLRPEVLGPVFGVTFAMAGVRGVEVPVPDSAVVATGQGGAGTL